MTDVTLKNYQAPTLPQLPGGDPVFWRNELAKISTSINLLVKQENTVTSEVNTLNTEVATLNTEVATLNTEVATLTSEVNAGLVSIPAHNVVGNATGSAANALPVSPLVGRSSSLLNIESVTLVGDTNYTILTSDRYINTSAAFTAPRTWTLPAVSTVNQGQTIRFLISATNTNTLTLAVTGADRFYVQQTASTPASLVFGSANIYFEAQALTNGGGSFWTITYLIDPPWTTWSPALFWNGGVPTSTFTVNSARYSQRGKTVNWAMSVSISAAGTTGNFIGFTPPVTPLFPGGGGGMDNNSGKALGVRTISGNSFIGLADASNFGNSTAFYCSGVYETS